MKPPIKYHFFFLPDTELDNLSKSLIFIMLIVLGNSINIWLKDKLKIKLSDLSSWQKSNGGHACPCSSIAHLDINQAARVGKEINLVNERS